MESRTQGWKPRTLKNFEAKDRPSRGQDQGHRRKCSQKKKVFKKLFQAKTVFKNFFSGDLYLRKPKKRYLQIFCKVSGVFQQNFNSSKIALSSSRGQGNFRGLEASRPRPRTSKCVLKDVLEAKDVLEDSTSANYTILATQRRGPWPNAPLNSPCTRLFNNSSCSVLSDTDTVVYYMKFLAAIFNIKIVQRIWLCAQTACQ